jgi:hypothetical protein
MSSPSPKSVVSDYNVLAIPSIIGDPFTCFDVQEEYGNARQTVSSYELIIEEIKLFIQ